MKKSIYLDYAAATPLDAEVLAAMQPYFVDEFYNPSGVYLAAKNTKKVIEKARSEVAKHLGCRPAELVFTAGATEANNLAIQGVMHEYPETEILISALEHDSVLEPSRVFKHQEIPTTASGMVDLAALTEMISPKTSLVSVMYVNNELGTIQPLAEVAKIVEAERVSRSKSGNKLPIYLHSDAAQAGNFLDLHVSRLGVDLMSINGGKIYGPKQTGVLYVKAGTVLQPLILGGGQEGGLRSGTENVAGIVGLAAALDKAQTLKSAESKRLRALRDAFKDKIETAIPQVIINGSGKNQAPHILHVTIPGTDNERLMMELDEAGIICAVGSACSAGSGEPSHVLSAIGLSNDLARSSLRFSLGRDTSQIDIEKTIEKLSGLLSTNR